MDAIPSIAWIILATSLISGTGCTLITCAVTARRMTGLYNRGWNAGREFAIRHLHNTIVR